jgi:hypothetical protein
LGKIVLKEKASIAAMSSLISREIIGKPMSRGFRSYGSMLLLHFGRLTKEPGLKRPYFRGEWTLLVEWADWTMTGSDSSRVTDRSEQALIDKIVRRLLKQPVTHLAFNAGGRLVVRLHNGMSLTVYGRGGPRRGSRLCLWSLSNDRHWRVTLGCTRRFVVYPDDRVA